MPSSAVETPPAIWAALARLRDVSRLVLVAIEDGDLERVARLAAETETLVAGLTSGGDSNSALSDEARALIEQITSSNRQVMERLTEEMRVTELEIHRVRQSRIRLKASKLPHPPANTARFDRET